MGIGGFDLPTSTVNGDVLATIEPDAAGFCSDRLARIRSVFDREVAERRLPGAVLAVARGGRLVLHDAVGYRDAATSQAMPLDAVFSIASMTKPMVSVAAMQLVEEGRIALGDPVGDYLPALQHLSVAQADADSGYSFVPADRPPAVLDLLRHTSGFTYQGRGTTPAHQRSPGSSMEASVRLAREDFLAALGDTPLLYHPGRAWEYGFSTDVLGHVIEAVDGGGLDRVLAQRIWQPLGMVDTGFVPSDGQQRRYALAFPTDPLTGETVEVLHASGAVPQWYSGGGGAVSTALDYLRFLEMMRGRGRLGADRVLSRMTVDMMTADQLGDDIVNRVGTMDAIANGYGFGLGFAVRYNDGGSGLYGRAGDYHWSGVYGGHFWVDPKEELSVVFLAAIPSLLRRRYRQLMRALVYQALID